MQFTNFLTAFITPIFLAQSSSGPYFLFAGLTIVTLVVLWLWMPETRGRSLESIQDDFKPPMEDLVGKAWPSRSLRNRFGKSKDNRTATGHSNLGSSALEMR